MDESGFIVEIVRMKLIPEVAGASTFMNGKHYIFINADVSDELQNTALERELKRKPF